MDGGLAHGHKVVEFGNVERRRKSEAAGAAARAGVAVERW